MTEPTKEELADKLVEALKRKLSGLPESERLAKLDEINHALEEALKEKP